LSAVDEQRMKEPRALAYGLAVGNKRYSALRSICILFFSYIRVPIHTDTHTGRVEFRFDVYKIPPAPPPPLHNEDKVDREREKEISPERDRLTLSNLYRSSSSSSKSLLFLSFFIQISIVRWDPVKSSPLNETTKIKVIFLRDDYS
jgi:hypothetical protein